MQMLVAIVWGGR